MIGKLIKPMEYDKKKITIMEINLSIQDSLYNFEPEKEIIAILRDLADYIEADNLPTDGLDRILRSSHGVGVGQWHATEERI